MRDMSLERSMVDPCLYYFWTDIGLVLIISWINDNMSIGTQEVVDRTKTKLMTYFECEDCGKMNNLTCLEDGGLKFTQDVLDQSFKDEFDISDKNGARLQRLDQFYDSDYSQLNPQGHDCGLLGLFGLWGDCRHRCGWSRCN